jgi:hypothetical protein
MNMIKLFKWFLIDQFKLSFGGGGGGGPSSTTSQTSNVPEYARPYVENMLGSAQKQIYNDDMTTFRPYQAYSSNPNDYVARYSPLQKTAQQGAADLETPDTFGQGATLAGMSGLGSLNAGRNFQNMATNPNAVGAYMNPYLQNSLQPQLEEMQRQYGITGVQQQAQATQQGAFGGGRDAIMAAENARNKNTAMNQAIGQGYNTAFNNAQQQMNAGAQLGLQGYNQAGQAGVNLSNIGNQQLGAQQGIIETQNKMGAQMQAQEQQKINQQIQDYATQQQYPFMQLGIMNSLLRGLPLQSTTTQSYQAQPAIGQQALGLGLGALGASKAFS